jgi:small GTP-binding protein
MNTIGANCVVYSTNVDDKDIKFQIWDLAGQPRFKSVRPVYYRGCVGIILIYDITRLETLQNAKNWVEEAYKHTGWGPVPVVLVANKEDLRHEVPFALSKQHGLELARNIDENTSNKGFTCKLFETSAKTGQNVNEAFRELGRKILTFIEVNISVTMKSRKNYRIRPQKI